ncbi:RHS repeat-associated core domain-containing protein [Flagellimonas pacifica]|uniref:RHS repeat-associated core domain-containing protein n=1 Tax=Flagellimonas pacifica TaxID=1247520 RepID=A0A285MCJ6_9FLAO|nr:RHS repeat-associated core domain-containing protein [Allomuricauda parva]SNY94433.1 RHS repeat-associated core domain-containing protein [Allomuricauda parva]
MTSSLGNSVANRWKYNGVEFEESLGLNLYEMPLRQYDPSIAKWTSIDPVTHFSTSTYTAFDNNPVFWADPSGADSWKYLGGGTYINRRTGEETTDWERAVGETENGSNSKPPNDIIVNSEGIVTKVIPNDEPHRVLDENGNELFFNDDAYDKIWLSGVQKNDRLFFNIENKLIAKFILKAGINTSIWKRASGLGYLDTAKKSHGLADFGFNQLRSEFNMYNTEYDGYSEGNGAFFRVGGESTIYNFADVSQFIWGAWMRANHYNLFEAKTGAHINNVIFGVGLLDSNADQRAIENGHNYMNNLILSWKK